MHGKQLCRFHLPPFAMIATLTGKGYPSLKILSYKNGPLLQGGDSHDLFCYFVPIFGQDGKRIAHYILNTVKILKFGTPQTIAIIVLKFDVTLH